MRVLALAILFLGHFSILAQGEIQITLSGDSIHFSDRLEIQVALLDFNGEFEPPSFSDFHVVSGPFYSSSYSNINGQIQQRKSYRITLMPKSEGHFTLELGRVKTESESFSIPSREIFVAGPDALRTRHSIPAEIVIKLPVDSLGISDIDAEVLKAVKRKIKRI